MSNPSALVFGDLHYSFEPPASRKDSYRSELDGMLDQISGIAKKLSPDAVCSVGDHFHRKGRTSHAEVVSLMSLYRKINDVAPFFSIPGNHDMVGHNVTTATESQPLGVLSGSGVVRLVHDNSFHVKFSGGSKTDIIVCGVPYTPDPSPAKIAAHVRSSLSGQTAKAVVVLLHHDIMGKDQGRLCGKAIREAVGVPVAIFNGHIHEVGWDINVGKDSVFVATGSIARTSIAEKDNRPSAVFVAFPSNGFPKVTYIPLVCLPVTEAFDAPDSSTGGNDDLDKFVELVGGDGEEPSTDVRQEVRLLGRELQVPDAGIEEAARLLEESYHRL